MSKKYECNLTPLGPQHEDLPPEVALEIEEFCQRLVAKFKENGVKKETNVSPK